MLCARTLGIYRVVLFAAFVAACSVNCLWGQGVEPPMLEIPASVVSFISDQPDPASDIEPPLMPDVTSPDTGTPDTEPDDAAETRTPRGVTPAPTRRFSTMRLASAGPSRLRLASVPNMLGDFYNATLQFQYESQCCGNVVAESDVPLAAGGRRLRISENNKSLPMDRVYFLFHHFHNVVDSNPNIASPFSASSRSLNRYTIGFEKTFLHEQCSLDVRLPLAEQYRNHQQVMGVEGGNLGNFSMILKGLLWSSDTCAAAIGLGADFPTGSDVNGHIMDTKFTVNNESVYLSPFFGFLSAPHDPFFVQGFLEVGIPVGGSQIEVVDPFVGRPTSLGSLNDQTLLHVDLVAGWWLYRNPYEYCLTGLAAILEYHYTTTLQDADVLSYSGPAGDVRFGNLLNRIDVSNMSAGLHAQIYGNTTLRTAVVFPLENRLDNPFDAEVNVSLNHYY